MTDITQILSAFSDKPAATSGAAGSASASPAQFVQQVGPLAKAVADRLNVDPSILIGQWGLETGWGKSVIPGTNNLGNIKDFSGRGIAAIDNMTGSRDKYRQYDSLDGFGDDFAGLIERRYQGAIGAGADAQRFASELKRGGYAEDPAYVEKLVRAAEMARNAGASEGWTPGSRQPAMGSPAAPGKTKSPRARLSEPSEFLSTDQGGKEADAARQQAMLDDGRTFGEAASDIGLGLTSGVGGIVELVGTGAGLASGNMDNMLRAGGASLREWAQDNQSKVLKAHKELRALRMDEMDEGPAKFFAYLAETLGSPELAIDFVAEQAPQLVVMGVTGRLAGGAARAAGLGAEGAGRTATGVAIGAGSAMQGMDAAGQAYDSIKKVPRALQLENPTVQKLMADGVPEDEAVERAARAAAATAGMASGGFSAVLNALPGAASIERALAGGVRQAGSRTAGAIKGFVGEGVSEALDEVGGVGAANAATQEFDPSQSITEGMSEAAAAGALFAPFGGVSGALGAGIDAPPAPVVKPNSPLQNAASAAAAVTPPAPVGATPASGPEGSIAPSAADPAAERLARIQSFVEDKAFLQGIRVTPEFGKESVSELLSAYAKARNPSVDPLLRERAMADIEAFIETFNNRPNFTLGGSGQDATQAPGTAVAPVAPSAVTAPQVPTDDGMTIDGEFREPDDRLAGANPNQLPAPPVLALPTEDALQAARDADAAYEQAYQDLVKAEQLGASEAELQAYQRALIEAQQLRDQMDAQPAAADAPAEAPTTNQPALTGPRRNPAQVSAFTPYFAGDVVTIDGQDWQVQQDMGGWYLTSTGNWRGMHPTIQKIRGMNELIAEIERAATAQTETSEQADAPAKVEAQPAYRLTFDQWLEQQWAGNRYRDAYLENAGGDERKAKYAAASGGGESEVSARNAYWSALMNAPRDADVSLEMYDSLTDEQKRDASRHFFKLDDLVRDRYQREAMQKKEQEDRVAREVIAPMQAEVDRLRSMNERTKSGTDAWNKRATDAANLEGLIADLRAGRITVQELPAKWRGEEDRHAAEETDEAAELWNALPEQDRYDLIRGQFNRDAGAAVRNKGWGTLTDAERNQARTAIDRQGLLVRALTAGVVSPDEYPTAEVAKSFNHVSNSPETGAYVMRNAFLEAVQREYEEAAPLAETAEQKAALDDAIAEFKDEYLRRDKGVAGVRSGAYSSKIAGRGNLDRNQVERRGNALDRASGAFFEWLNSARGKVKAAVLAARNDDQRAAEQQAKDDKAAKRAESERALIASLINFKKGDDVQFGRYPVAKVSFGKDGYPTSVTVEATDLTDNKFDLARTLFRGDKAKLRAIVDEVRAQQAKDAGQTETQAKADDSLAAQHEALMASVREGTATPEAFKASFEQVVANAEAIKAELSKKTKAELLREGGPYLQMRYANETKGEIVDALYRQMIGEYALGESVTYGLGRNSYQDAVRRMVEATNADKLEQYVKDRAAAIEEAKVARAARAEALANPQTLNDFRSLLNTHIQDGKTRHEAFLMLTPEQRIRYDELEAESTREAREARKRAAQTEVRAAGQTTGGQIIATKHTRDGYDLFVVQLADRLSAEDYKTVLAGAKRLGGWYSSFRGKGAVPGFQFKTREDAEAFLKLAGGDVTAAKDQVAQRRDAFADDKSQSAVERLTEMADRMEQDANAEESRDRKANTARRARFASAALNAAAAQKAMARTMRNIAQAIQEGRAKFLDAVRTRTQVDALLGYVRTAKDKELRAKYPSYAEQEKRKGEPATAETAGFADFPSYTAFRSDLAMLGRQMLEVDGTKKLGQRLMSVADDVTDAYLEFARDNIRAVSQFGRGDALAEFASRDDAERAIRRSGLVGKAIVLPIKRGQNRVILSPSEAMSRKVWAGDGDKRITLSGEFGKELVEAIGRRGNKTNGLAVPWQFQTTYDRRKLLSRIGIETPSEFRSALREVIALQETAVANKVREMELAMVGRRADGLDFFPTPAAIADQMVEAADISPDMAVLEPSAGMGHIADRIRAAGAEPDVVEISADRRELLEEKGFHAADVNDFLDLKPREFFTYGDIFRAPDGTQGVLRGVGGMGSQRVRLEDEQGNQLGLYNRDELEGVAHRGTASGYDRIIMNPPFSDRRDAEHVQHAYTLLRPGGRIVAIMGEGVFFGQDKKAQEFRDWLDAVGGTVEKLPEGTFMDPSLPVNTGVNARMVVIDRAPTPDSATEGDPRYEISDSGDPSPEEAQTVQVGIEGKNPIEAAAWLADNAPPEYATIAAKVRDKLRSLNDMGAKFGMAIVTGGDLGEVEMSGARGAVIPTKQGGDIALKVVINGADMKGRVGTSYRTVTHELVHAATMQSIQLGKRGVSQYEQATRDLFDVANAIAGHINERARNAPESLSDFEISILEGRSNFLSSADEVLAWALTSPDAQSYLESIPYKRKSAWTAFVEAVRKVLGLSASSDTALSEVLRVAEVLLTPIDAAALAGFTLNKINHSDGHRYEVQQPADLPGGLSIHKSPGGLPPVAWTDGAPVVMRSSETIPETINVDGADRPTRNSSGQPIHLTEAGIRNFWRWFGDSKAVDAGGRPLVVYHATDADFDAFDPSFFGRNTDANASDEAYAETARTGFWFNTRDVSDATGQGVIMPVYLSIQSPKEYDSLQLLAEFAIPDAGSAADFRDDLERDGYDGVVIDDEEFGGFSYVAFRPEQIKSATGNNGDFSSESGSILLRDATSNASTQGVIDRVEADAFIRGVVERYPESPEIIVARTFAQLPEAAQQGAYNQGSDEYSTKGVFHGGKVYVVMGNHTTMADLEATVFHELLGHAGVRKMFGAPFVQRLNQVFIGLGGQAGLVRIMKRRGMGDQMQRYIRGALQAQKIDADRFRQAVANGDPRARRVWTDAMMRSVLTEEVLAHIAEQIGERPGLLDRFLEMMGRIRQWLRDHGFARLSNLGESDLLYMLSQARESLRGPGGPGGSRVVKEGKGELFDKDGSTLTKAEKDALAVVLGALDENSPRRDQALQAMRMLGIQREPGVTMFSIRSGSPAINKANQRTALFTALAKFDDAFQQPTPTGKTVEEIAREIDPSYRAKAMPAAMAKDKTRGRAVKMWEISVPKSSARSGYLYEDARGRVWIDVSRLQPGIDAGNKIYGIAAGYAHNTGKVFIGDPEGLSPTALFRRLENMISSALRFGTTDHLYPHAAQVDPQGYFADSYPEFAPQTKGLGLDWRDGDFSHNLTEMLLVSYNASARFAPEIKEIVYDFDSRQFVDAATGDRRDRRDFARISEGLRGESQTRYRGGSATLARAALVNTLLRRGGKEAWGAVVASLGDQLRGRGLDFELGRIFYQRTPDAAADGLTADQFRAALVDHFGEAGVKSLEQQGLLNIVDQNDPEVGGTLDPNNPAWYNPETGEAFFVPSVMSDARDAVEAVYHEIGAHHGLPSMLGESGWRALKSRVAMAAKGSGEIGRAWRSVIDNYPEFADLADAGYDRAAQNDRFMHEVIAKVGESAAGRKSSIWTFLQDRVRAFLRSIGLEPRISAEDVAALVQGSMKRVMTNGGNDGPRGGSRMNQMRSAPSSPSEFFASSQGRRSVRDRIGDVFSAVTSSDGVRTFNWWNRTVGSQYHKAKKSPEFRKVYELAHAYVDEISRIANSAAGQAKNILPHLDSWKDIGAGLNIRKQWADAKDYQAIASAVFDGTLANGSTGTVWTDEQLRDQFGLNDKQIGLYREFRAAVDVSLESLATSEMARAARVAKLETADPEMTMGESLAFYTDQVDAVIEKAKADIEDLSFGHEQERTMFEEEFGSMRPGATEDARKIMAARQRQEMAELETALRDAESLRSNFTDKASQIRKLQSEGYAPLMRFGQYTVDVVRLDEDGNPAMNEAGEPDRPFFGMFETEAEAREAERVLREEYPDYTVTRGIMSAKANEMFKGVTPETAEMFARLLGTDQEGAFQAYLKQAVANRSAMKRLIERKGMAGFAQDVPRVLAAFVTSNARLSAGNWHFGEMNKAVQDIPREMGDVKDEAIKLVDYIQNPQEEAAGLRGFLFFSFLGGSVAAALVNTTQTFSTTLPYLHQFSPKGSAAAITRAMGVAYKAMRKGLDVVKDDDMRAALKRAADEGVVDPQEIHLLMAESGGNGASSFVGSVAGMVRGDLATPASRVARAATQAWGSLFGMAEKYNRHVAFMAAWEVAGNMSEVQIKATGAKDRYDFAKRAVTETQFEYRKISRPNLARGAIGATLFTFKTFLVNYLEFVARLPARERALAIAVLLLMAGMSGAPGLEDMEDLIDTIGQKFGYNWNSAASRHAWMMKTLGEGGANFVEHGISSFLPIDVSARLGVGNIIPASDILKKSNDQKWRSAAELLGPIGSVIEGATKVFDGVGTGKAFGELIRPVAPKAYNDIYQAIDILQTGYYRDSRGRKVVEADALDAFMKSIGFQPNAVAEPRRVEWMIGQSVRMQRVIRSDIYELWSRGVFESDAEKVALAKAMLMDWNRKNPETPIKANPQSIAQRVKAMRSTSAERTVKATPKEMRGMISDQLAITE